MGLMENRPRGEKNIKIKKQTSIKIKKQNNQSNRMKKDNSDEQKRESPPGKTHIEKYHANPFTNSKEDYYNEKTLRIICSILLCKNIKRVDCVVLDLLFNFL
ncbi:hypothetical protein PCYB_102680 [Plasmodium cynomolgi strain B]|uniref:Uncharacterized protein n=1 Tax=Plasmodium cynomolgi (strain B) TaxID=1120755 RepID=K6UKK9_PLACD|nr:hypothetical protein PCYB_102680 [Plasmodium cynomolgi strain B]GAB66918.1 hypothetical protein PCYB_102680 [Plasmodium cynomolgi strain B]